MSYVTRHIEVFPRTHLLRPISDISAGNWISAPLYDKIREVTANDADYIHSTTAEVATDISEVKFDQADDPNTSSGHIVRYRIRKEPGVGTTDMTVRLRQGASTIASWTHTGLSTSFTTFTQTLSSGEADSITDYTDLRLKFEATTT